MDDLDPNVRNILHAAAAGLELRAVGGELVFRCHSLLAPAQLSTAYGARSQIVGYLTRPGGELSADDWRRNFDSYEAAAAAAGGSPQMARSIAIETCISVWLQRHPAGGAPKVCAHCGLGPLPKKPISPREGIPEDFAWLHISCEQPWSAARRSDAAKALARTGIIARDEVPPAAIASPTNPPTTWNTIESAYIKYQSSSTRVCPTSPTPEDSGDVAR